MADRILTPKDFKSLEHTWCPGCGDAGIMTAVHRALAELQIPPHRIAIVGGIGCFAKLPEYVKCNGVDWLHGRGLAFSIGVKLANPKLTVLDTSGDGDHYGIGIEHIIHACRRNPDITTIVSNNQNFALTKGQASPTSHEGLVTPTTPKGARERPIDPVEIAVSAGATFVARAYAYNQKELTEIIKAGINHKGYSLIDVLSPCPTQHREPKYNKLTDYYEDIMLDIHSAYRELLKIELSERSLREGVRYEVEGMPPYDPTNKEQVQKVLRQTELFLQKTPTGIIYAENGRRPTMEDNLDIGMPAVDLDISIGNNQCFYEEFKEIFR